MARNPSHRDSDNEAGVLTRAKPKAKKPAPGAPAQKAINFIHTAQNYGLGWRYTPKCGNNDTSVASNSASDCLVPSASR